VWREITRRSATKLIASLISKIPAVKNHRVYGIYHTASRSLSDLAAAQFMAKALYPKLFEDIDPQKTFMDFHKNYLPIIPSGTFFIKLKD
jgi:iron complex transport system substrate-binding protein